MSENQEPGGKVVKIEPRFKLRPFNELTVGSELAYLVKGIIPRVGLTVVWGPPKCGKSFWAFDLSMHVSLGWMYRGRRVQPGAVVYCAFEGAEGFKARAEAFRFQHLSEDHDHIDFYLIAARTNLVVDHGELIAAIRVQCPAKPVLVVLDTLNRSLQGSESDDKDMAAYVRAADAIRDVFTCAVVIVHHCGVETSRPRGHTSLTGAADAQLAVKRDTAGNILTTIEFMKDGPEGETVASRLESVEVGIDSDGDPITSCIVVPIEGAAAQPRTSKGDRLPKAVQTTLRALQEALEEQGEAAPASNHIPPTVKVVPVLAWRQQAYRRGISSSDEERARQQAFKRAYEHLLGSNRIGTWDGLVWLTQ
jgi:hypothetical protein